MLTSGAVVCGYRIERVLGTGGMGTVYLAVDPSLPRQTALKVLSCAVHVIAQVAKALDFAHAHNVVHRDVKPGNLLLSGPIGPDERVLLGMSELPVPSTMSG